MDLLQAELSVFCGLTITVYSYIFPEYPSIGLGVVALSLLLFVVYLFKSGFFQAVKIAVVSGLVLTFILLVLHHLAKILHLNLMF